MGIKYVPALDGLRAIAVLMVVLLHTHVPGVGGGHYGVDVFFVLSGYLITSILLAEHRATGRIALGNFYWRRALRLYPALLAMLAVYVALAPLAWPDHPHGRDALLAGLYLSDYAYAFWRMPEYLGHTWSLAAEEHFYLLWPLLLIGLLRWCSPHSLVRKVAICMFAVWAWRVMNKEYFGAEVGFRFDTRMVGMLAGCWLAAVAAYRPDWLARVPAKTVGLVGAGMLALLTVSPWIVPHWMQAAELASLGLIVGANTLPLTNRWLVWLGKLSYGVYLWHFPIAKWLNPLTEWWQAAPLTLALSIGAAWLSFNTVEAVARRYRTVKPPACIPDSSPRAA